MQSHSTASADAEAQKGQKRSLEAGMLAPEQAAELQEPPRKRHRPGTCSQDGDAAAAAPVEAVGASETPGAGTAGAGRDGQHAEAEAGALANGDGPAEEVEEDDAAAEAEAAGLRTEQRLPRLDAGCKGAAADVRTGAPAAADREEAAVDEGPA